MSATRACGERVVKETSTLLTVEDLSFDVVSERAVRAGQVVELSPKEWAMLEMFMRHPHQILSRMQILNRVWTTASTRAATSRTSTSGTCGAS